MKGLRSATAIVASVLLAVSGCADGEEPVGGPPPVASISIDPLPGTVWAGGLNQLNATPRAANGTPLPDRPVTWSGGDEAIAVVDAAGRLEARGAGTTVIVATSEGKQGQLAMTVAEQDILYEGYRTGLPEMFALSLRGGEPVRLLPPHTIIGDPTPSPDGSRIAFVIADYESWTGDIFVVNRDGTNLRQITPDGALDDQPAWSPDGTRIAFRSYRLERQGDIWVMNADGTNPVLLTPDPLPATVDVMRPAWSPDGTRIAYAGNAGGSVNIWSMRADGADKVQLTNTSAFDTEPTWSPDGQWIAFRRSTPEEGSDIMIMPAAGGVPTRIALPSHQVTPAWSPDGRFIAYTELSPSGGSPQVYTMKPDGSEVTLRTSDYTWNGGRSPKWLRRTTPSN
jgi:Tol biopolymer transport system component